MEASTSNLFLQSDGAEQSGRQASFIVDSGCDGCSCGDLLRLYGVSRRLTARLKRIENGITVNGVHARTCDIVHSGDVVSIGDINVSFLEPNPELDVPTVYEDDSVVIFNKPAGMPVHPSIKHRFDTLGNCFAAMYPELTFRPINRLDRDTSGLCAVARSAFAAKALGGNISKIYIAVVRGSPVPNGREIPDVIWRETGNGYRIEAPIARAEQSVITRRVCCGGREAVTNYTIEGSDGEYSLVRIELETGRTHQIRVHFSAVGHPLAGDDLYGGDVSRCSRQALHCSEMSFRRLTDGEAVHISCGLPQDMASVMRNA